MLCHSQILLLQAAGGGAAACPGVAVGLWVRLADVCPPSGQGWWEAARASLGVPGVPPFSSSLGPGLHSWWPEIPASSCLILLRLFHMHCTLSSSFASSIRAAERTKGEKDQCLQLTLKVPTLHPAVASHPKENL